MNEEFPSFIYLLENDLLLFLGGIFIFILVLVEMAEEFLEDFTSSLELR
jgi:hypothetical protein